MQNNAMLASKDNETLLAEYKQTGSLEIKQELVLRYVYIVKYIAKQMRNVYVSFSQLDDIINEGVLVLLQGIDRFDIEAGVKFETYISKRIRGMIIDLARKQDWVPRSVRKTAKDIDKAISILYEELNRQPTDEEIAAYVQLPMDKYEEVMKKNALSNVLSLNMVLDDAEEEHSVGAQVPSDNIDEQPEEAFLQKELVDILADGVASLNEKEQLVVSLYYKDEMNMKSIAQILEISEPRVSQIHGKAIEKLQDYMKAKIGG